MIIENKNIRNLPIKGSHCEYGIRRYGSLTQLATVLITSTLTLTNYLVLEHSRGVLREHPHPRREHPGQCRGRLQGRHGYPQQWKVKMEKMVNLNL